jgi:tetratricopeptide (TPR) repeat protein
MPGMRLARLLLGIVLLAVWLAAGGVASANDAADQPRTSRLLSLDGQLCPLEERLFADASDGRLDEFSLLEAALVAGGVEDAGALEPYRRQQAALLGEIRRLGSLSDGPRRQAQIVLELMHDRLLQGGYRSDCTDLRTTFEKGQFNCVSASVLFNCLAGELGLAVCGLEIPAHAISRLKLPDGPLDIETTYSHWFQFIDDPQRQAELVENAIGRDPALDRSQAREVGPVEMVAMIYYNQGIELLAGGRFPQAATANAKALRLDPASTTARGNLLATINTWAIALGSSGQYARAVELLGPGFETFGPNYVHVHHEWVEHLCRYGRFAEALHVLGRAAAEMPEQEYFPQAAANVYRRCSGRLPGNTAAGRVAPGWAMPADGHATGCELAQPPQQATGR